MQHPTLKEGTIAKEILRQKHSRLIFRLSNVYIYDEESDVFVISRSGYTHEYEIKLSRSDYLNDFKKTKHKLMSLRKVHDEVVVPGYKHPNYSSCYIRQDFHGNYHTQKMGPVRWEHYRCDIRYKSIKENLPNRFSFAVPEGMVIPEEIPEYAGLCVIDSIGQVKELKKAPLLHKSKFDKWQYLCMKYATRNRAY